MKAKSNNAQNVSQPVAVFKFPGLFFWRSLK
jgi:hypothetical protein